MTLARIAARSTLALFTAGLLAACGGSQPEPQPAQSFASENQAPSPPMTVAPPPAPAEATPPPAAAAPAAPAEEPLTDEKIAAIIDAANSGEIEQAKVAQKNAKDARVKAFAAHMIADHGKNQADSQALLKKIKVTPMANDVSAKIQSDSQEIVTRIGALKGGDFDKDYIDAQVKEHQAVLDMIDTKLLVQVKNPELKAAIQAFRPKVEHHLGEAKTIQASLVGK